MRQFMSTIGAAALMQIGLFGSDLEAIGVGNTNISKVDVAIIGGGCAGLSGAMVTTEYGYKTVVIEGPKKGGELNVETIVGNWPGKSTCLGKEIIADLEEQAKRFGTIFVEGKVVSLNGNSSGFCLLIDSGKVIQAKTVLIATGSKEKKPDSALGFDEYLHKGIWSNEDVYEHLKDFNESMKGQEVMILGGGVDGMKKAVYAARSGAKKIFIVLRGPEFRLPAWRHTALLRLPQIEIIKESQIASFEGEGGKLTKVTLQTARGKEVRSISHVVMAIGWEPESRLFNSLVSTDPKTGAILVDGLTQKTNVEGIYAAGDVTTSCVFGQGAIAASDGMKAGYEMVAFLMKRAHEIK